MTARIARIGVPLAAVAIVVALRPEIATGTFSSATSVLKVVAVVVAWMAFAWVVRRFIPNQGVRTAIVAVAGAGLLWFTVAPYFRDKTVDDAFPAVAAATPTTLAPIVVDAAAPAPAPATTVPPVPTGPVRLASGALRGLAGHRGSGQAVLYRQPDGSHLIRLEDFDVSSVPAPVVYLVPGAGQERPGGVKLGALRGNQGNLNIAVPAGTDPSGTQTLLIWCEAFSVPVAAASI